MSNLVINMISRHAFQSDFYLSNQLKMLEAAKAAYFCLSLVTFLYLWLPFLSLPFLIFPYLALPFLTFSYLQGVPKVRLHFVFVIFSGSRAHTEELFIAIE